MPHRAAALILALTVLALPAAGQDASGAAITADNSADPAAPARAEPVPPIPVQPATVAIELGDVEIKVRSLRIVLTLDPDRALALGEAIAGMTVQAGPAGR